MLSAVISVILKYANAITVVQVVHMRVIKLIGIAAIKRNTNQIAKRFEILQMKKTAIKKVRAILARLKLKINTAYIFDLEIK